MKRILGPLLLTILILGVGAAIFLVVGQQIKAMRIVTVRGLIGSEKQPFFEDERVQKVFREHGLDVRVEKAGSREIATRPDLKQYDFGFPAGTPAAEKMRLEQGASKMYSPFFTPMAIASWKPVVQILVANRIAQDEGGYYSLDMAAFLKLVSAGKRWSEMDENSAYAVNKNVLINSTDVRSSNSAAMYLALASYVANGDNVVQSETEIQQVLPLMADLFLKQGYVEHSSAAPFEDYLVMGMGKAPMVMIYEAQFIAAALAGSITPDMALLYPQPTIFSKHTLVAFSAGGERVGELLSTDPELQRLAIEYGFRNTNTGAFREMIARAKLTMPESIVNVVDTPSYQVLESMIQQIEQKY